MGNSQEEMVRKRRYLTPEERGDIIKLAKDDKHMDLSHRQLSVLASETGEVEVSTSSFYRVMKQEQLMKKRQRKPKTPQAKPEVKSDGPNQVWSWDLTYIALGLIFVYLFAIIDIYSPKIVCWHLGFNARVEPMKKPWDKALVNENLIGVSGAPKLSIALSDHGAIGYMTQEQKYTGQAEEILTARAERNAWLACTG